MKAYASYIYELRHLLLNRRAEASFQDLAEGAVNGEASARLLELVPPSGLKRSGAFFSSSKLSKQTVAKVRAPSNNRKILIVDPACGAGDLLLRAAHKLKVKKTLMATLRSWGESLAGFDLHREFIQAAHLRLAILALSRGADFDLAKGMSLAALLPLIRKGDGLKQVSLLSGITHLVMNPPFCPITAPKKCTWATGKVTKAAVFFARCVEMVPSNTRITGILPDVLRAGARYQRWREHIEQMAAVIGVTTLGNFKTADVDVFLLELKTHDKQSKRKASGHWWPKRRTHETVGKRFEVHVGPVVPHRLKRNEGPVYPFLHAKELPVWGEFTPGEERVAFAGRPYRPPFVAVRRTSSPSDKHRAIGTIVKGTKLVAAENHLLLCVPKSGGLQACKALLKALKRPATDAFVNKRIRCRHLTVGVLKEIPW